MGVIQTPHLTIHFLSQARIILQLRQVGSCLFAESPQLILLLGHLLLHRLVDRLLVTNGAALCGDTRFSRGGGRDEGRGWLIPGRLRIEMGNALGVDPLVNLRGQGQRAEGGHQAGDEEVRTHANS
ncbi:hypothetical protein D3C73_1284750 [compost metagenome]